MEKLGRELKGATIVSANINEIIIEKDGKRYSVVPYGSDPSWRYFLLLYEL
jgi:hypothetical protein